MTEKAEMAKKKNNVERKTVKTLKIKSNRCETFELT
jgi:hypothetical protein